MPTKKASSSHERGAHGTDFHGDMRKGAYLKRRAEYHSQRDPVHRHHRRPG